jgi:hypothetical protein
MSLKILLVIVHGVICIFLWFWSAYKLSFHPHEAGFYKPTDLKVPPYLANKYILFLLSALNIRTVHPFVIVQAVISE